LLALGERCGRHAKNGGEKEALLRRKREQGEDGDRRELG